MKEKTVLVSFNPKAGMYSTFYLESLEIDENDKNTLS